VGAPPQNTGDVNLLEAYRDLQSVRIVSGYPCILGRS
jgi:hypothetical protein